MLTMYMHTKKKKRGLWENILKCQQWLTLGDGIMSDLNFHFFIFPYIFLFFNHWHVFFFNQMKTISVTKKLQTKFAADHKAHHINKQSKASHFKKTDVITDRVVGKHASQRPFPFSKDYVAKDILGKQRKHQGAQGSKSCWKENI